MATPDTGWSRARLVCPLLIALTVAGCEGMEPYDPPNEREDGPQRGIFSGADGEFVLIGSEG